MNCRGKLKSGDACPYTANQKVDPSGRFCSRHKYLVGYTDDELANCKQCSDCKRWIRLEQNYKTCNGCQLRSVENRKTLKVKKTNEPDCDACIIRDGKIINKGVNKNQYGKNYCNLHNKMYTWFDELGANGRKPCANYNRKCPTKDGLPKTSKEKYCDFCSKKLLDKSRTYDAKRNEKRHNATDTDGMCNSCFKTFDDSNEFIDNKDNETMKCNNCRETQRRRDRDMRARGVKKSYPLSEATKAKKRQWKKDNHDKVAEYCLRHRAGMMEQKGEQYWVEKAEYVAEWRKQNPENVKITNSKRKASLDAKLSYYKYRASKSGIKWELMDEEAFEYFKGKCHFCGIEPGESNNGIDRLNNSIDYVSNNVVSCCEMCNMIKSGISESILIERSRAILAHIGIIDDEYGCTYAYPYRICASFNKYISSAKQRNINFNLENDCYYDLINQCCYLCGTETYYRNTNGIDRVSSSQNYDFENVRPCCSECNYLKKEYDYDEFIEKLQMINNHMAPEVYKPNKMQVVKDMMIIYAYSQTENCFVRCDYVIENLDLGIWTLDCNPKKNMFRIRSDKCYEDTVQEICTIDSGKCQLPYLMISQSHNKFIPIDPKSALNIDDIETAQFATIVNNCVLLGMNYYNSHKMQLCITKSRNVVIGIEIKYIQNEFQKSTNVCKCNWCEKHNSSQCDCSICCDHACHSVIDNCYWCSLNGTYFDDTTKSVINIVPNGEYSTCKNVVDYAGVSEQISTYSQLNRYREMNKMHDIDVSLLSIYDHKRPKKTKKELKIIRKKEIHNRKKQMVQNYNDLEWRKKRVQTIVDKRASFQ